jgi:hypothetical protein
MNMADGANGLIPGITFAAFFVFAVGDRPIV